VYALRRHSTVYRYIEVMVLKCLNTDMIVDKELFPDLGLNRTIT